MRAVLHKATLQWVLIASLYRGGNCIPERVSDGMGHTAQWVIEIEAQVSQTPESVSWLFHCGAFVDPDDTPAREFMPIRTLTNNVYND